MENSERKISSLEPRQATTAVAQAMNRRLFLQLSGQGALGLALLSQLGIYGCGLVSPAKVMPTPTLQSAQSLTTKEWTIIEATLDHLLPSEPQAPGARDINAIGYLDAALTGSDLIPEKKTKVKQGTEELNFLSIKLNALDFNLLDQEQKETTLRNFEQTDTGEIWLGYLLGFSMEALLGDPAYGGNTNQVGWRWLGHTPGFPRPPLIQIGQRR